MGKNSNGNGRNSNAVIGHPNRFVPPGHEIEMLVDGQIVYICNSIGTAPGRKEPYRKRTEPIAFATMSAAKVWLGQI